MKSNWVEWVALAVSVTVIAGVLGFLVVDGLTNPGTRAMPEIRIDAGSSYETELGWLVPATLRNDGDAPAERVVVEASAEIDGERETSEVSVDFLPPGSDVQLFFGFSAEPEGEIETRIVGFLAP